MRLLKLIACPVALAVAALLLPSTAAGAPLKLRVYQTPPGDPRSIIVGPDRNLWFTSDNGGNFIGRLTPRGRLTTFPTPGAAPDSITIGPDRALWITLRGGDSIVRSTTRGEMRAFPIAPGAAPRGITSGADGALWFTEFGLHRISRMTTDGRYTPLLAGFTPGGEHLGIVRGPDRAIWFTEPRGDRIGRIGRDGRITGYPVQNASGPEAITVGPDRNLWFTEDDGDRIGRVTPDGRVREWSAGITPGANPFGITAGPDKAVWFTEYDGDRLGRVTPDGFITEYRLPRGSKPMGLVTGPDRALWVALSGSDRVVRVTPPAPPMIGASITQTVEGNAAAVRFTSLLVKDVPRFARITVRCFGRGCPLRRLSRRGPKLNVMRHLRRRPLRAGQRLEVSISAPAYSTRMRRYQLRRGRPLHSDYCVPPGKRPRARC